MKSTLLVPRSYRYNSEWMPEDFPHDFDAHIYFPSEQLDFIRTLREKICTHFKTDQVFVGDVIPEPIGPHTLPMLEVNFSKALYADIVAFLVTERGSLNILVHPQTGDDYYDHTQGAQWLGHPVNLKLEVFK